MYVQIKLAVYGNCGGICLKKFKFIAYIFLFFILCILGFTIYSIATKDDTDDEKEKAKSEIRYLETKIVDLFNNMNNIETRNYKIYTTKIEESGEAETSGQKSSETNSQSNNSSNTNNSEQQTSLENKNTTDNTDNYEMKQSGILTSDRDTNWSACKNEIELIYTSISTVTLDLYHLNISKEYILKFNEELDKLTISVENENKQETLDNLVNLYDLLPKFAENIIDDVVYKTMLQVKLNIFKAYSKLDTDNWEEINIEISKAVDNYSNLLTNPNVESYRLSSLNKGYITLNELKNVANIKDKTVFFIKYKNLLEEINNI